MRISWAAGNCRFRRQRNVLEGGGEAEVDSRASSGQDGLGREESEKWSGENVCLIPENGQRV